MWLSADTGGDRPSVAGQRLNVRFTVWQSYAVEFVGALTQKDFDIVNYAAEELDLAVESRAVSQDDARKFQDAAFAAERVLEPVLRTTWFDRHVWRL